MNTALLVLRITPGALVIGHGLQKLVPAKYSPPLLHTVGPRTAAAGFQMLGIHPALPSVLLAGTAEVCGGFSLSAGLLTPIGTMLVSAVLTTAILTAHFRNGIWNHEGGFEWPLTVIVCSYVITALGPGSHSLDSAFGVGNWAGINWSMGYAGRAAIVVAVGIVGGLLPLVVAAASKPAGPQQAAPSAEG